MYEEDDFIDLSGIQHFSFCRRQWALIHIEQQWVENERTIDGSILHENAHNECFFESRSGSLVVRGMRVHSVELGISGICDVVEFLQSPNGVEIIGRKGKWIAFPVEYKRGADKENDADRLQVCCQLMCLEEMLGFNSDTGFIYYGETRHRSLVSVDENLRTKAREMILEMHELLSRGYTPKVRFSNSCNACSLKQICLPKIEGGKSALEYVKAMLSKEDVI
ncbi:MAG: CRISPR-associated protein Cas4 [Candidatus Cloacimonetes bacterium]|nr:CRISPR-associated protein Cas4 [Candidatus Cloacimonadota bacterium]